MMEKSGGGYLQTRPFILPTQGSVCFLRGICFTFYFTLFAGGSIVVSVVRPRFSKFLLSHIPFFHHRKLINMYVSLDDIGMVWNAVQ